MVSRATAWRAFAVCLLAAAVPQAGRAQIDAGALRTKAEPSLCVVVVEGPLGMPIAYASGFLVGQGRFVVTDLASVAQPGAVKVNVRFSDGATAEAKTFGMADAAAGLVALCTDTDPGSREGLALQPKPVGADGLGVVAVGWQWGETLNVTQGRVVPGPTAADLAKDAGCKPPTAGRPFLTFLCPGCDLATGAPVFGPEGSVVGVLLQVVGPEKPVVVPTAALRQALLAAGTNLRPVSDLPGAIWPTDVVVRAGRPPTPASFAAAVRLVKRRSVCQKCKGTGKIWVRRFVGTRRVMNRTQRIYRKEQQTCSACNGQGIVFPDGLYEQFGRMAEGATTLISAPATPVNVRKAALTNSMGLLDALSQVSRTYRESLVKGAATDLRRAKAEFPRGFLTHAQVAETVRLRGDKFTVLCPADASTPLIVNADMLSGYYGPKGGTGSPPAKRGQWVVTGGTLVGAVKVQGQRLLFARLFGWAGGPSMASGPARPPLKDERPAPSQVASARPRKPAKPSPAAPVMPSAGLPPGERELPDAEPVEPAAPRTHVRPPRPIREKKPGEPSFFGL